jgi:transglutaminase-like putative cysteine protease
MSHVIGTTHAWAEVYLPGAGWKGFDPTIGEMAGIDHIAVAVARLPESVPPVAGSFTGASDSVLDVGVWVSKC